jgi:glutamate---cysteine ligase / carboxylate-amine ligase
MSEALRLAAFTACGIELEYMIVDRATLAVRPIADELLAGAAGAYVNDVDRGPFGWSNELALHLVEIKNADPRMPLASLPDGFAGEVHEIDRRLAPLGACLMPTAIHPFMQPRTNVVLWPHAYAEIYRAYDRIFDCRRHGWGNLQSMHVNLPFADDREFARLHAAIRQVLPILPALAASSPIADGRPTGHLDYRLECYRTHTDRVPELMGEVIPDPAAGEAEYRARILEPMYRAIAPHDPDEDMRDEWLNSRGAIARFDRNAIEIRVIDTQECPRADIAVATATLAVVRSVYERHWGDDAESDPLPASRLLGVLRACGRDADAAVIEDAEVLRRFGFPAKRARAHELWSHLLAATCLADPALDIRLRTALDHILERGPLARRILAAVGPDADRPRIERVYRELCECLVTDRLFDGSRM